LIAPGGKTAYLGPSKDCQQYFEDIGYLFDPEVNPADILMDIVSGKAPNTQFPFTPEDLTRVWQDRSFDKGPFVIKRDSKLSLKEESIRHSREKKHNEFHEVAPDLIKERGANFFVQMWYCHLRSLLQQVSLVNSMVLEITVGILSGFVLGVSLQDNDKLFTGLLVEPFVLMSPATVEWVPSMMSFVMGFIATLAAAPGAVKVFSWERPVYWREASAGHNRLAYFLGKNISVLYRAAICSLHFAAPLHILAKPMMSFATMYLIVFSLYFGIYGISFFISMLVSGRDAALLAVIVCLFHGVSAGFGYSYRQATNAHIGWLFDMCFNRWITEILWTETVKPFSHLYQIEVSSKHWGLTLDRTPFGFGMVILSGVIWRVLAAVAMLYTQIDKQR
jgi:hypothetical protein